MMWKHTEMVCCDSQGYGPGVKKEVGRKQKGKKEGENSTQKERERRKKQLSVRQDTLCRMITQSCGDQNYCCWDPVQVTPSSSYPSSVLHQRLLHPSFCCSECSSCQRHMLPGKSDRRATGKTGTSGILKWSHSVALDRSFQPNVQPVLFEVCRSRRPFERFVASWWPWIVLSGVWLRLFGEQNMSTWSNGRSHSSEWSIDQ